MKKKSQPNRKQNRWKPQEEHRTRYKKVIVRQRAGHDTNEYDGLNSDEQQQASQHPPRAASDGGGHFTNEVYQVSQLTLCNDMPALRRHITKSR